METTKKPTFDRKYFGNAVRFAFFAPLALAVLALAISIMIPTDIKGFSNLYEVVKVYLASLPVLVLIRLFFGALGFVAVNVMCIALLRLGWKSLVDQQLNDNGNDDPVVLIMLNLVAVVIVLSGIDSTDFLKFGVVWLVKQAVANSLGIGLVALLSFLYYRLRSPRRFFELLHASNINTLSLLIGTAQIIGALLIK